jgi:hypothetical protein
MPAYLGVRVHLLQLTEYTIWPRLCARVYPWLRVRARAPDPFRIRPIEEHAGSGRRLP